MTSIASFFSTSGQFNNTLQVRVLWHIYENNTKPGIISINMLVDANYFFFSEYSTQITRETNLSKFNKVTQLAQLLQRHKVQTFSRKKKDKTFL